MDEHKISFIICTNDELKFNECVWYLDQLAVPQGYFVECIPVRNAKSMVKGYAEGQRNSDAKYKVYIHQDTFIIEKDFIVELLNAFNEREDIGLIGVIGSNSLSPDAIMWNKWNCGRTIGFNGERTFDIVQSCKKDVRDDICAVDGMLMATQYDVAWREDLDIGWDFYDITQSIEYLIHGYKIGVLNSEKSFTLHDCGPSKLMSYDRARALVLKEYSGIFKTQFNATNYYDTFVMLNRISELLQEAVHNKDYVGLGMMLRELLTGGLNYCNYDICLSKIFYNIYIKESAEGVFSFLGTDLSFEEMKQKYEKIKSVIRRVWYEDSAENIEHAKKIIKLEECSEIALTGIIETAVTEDKVEEIKGKVIQRY